jgi:hypothetical protein
MSKSRQEVFTQLDKLPAVMKLPPDRSLPGMSEQEMTAVVFKPNSKGRAGQKAGQSRPQGGRTKHHGQGFNLPEFQSQFQSTQPSAMPPISIHVQNPIQTGIILEKWSPGWPNRQIQHQMSAIGQNSVLVKIMQQGGKHYRIAQPVRSQQENPDSSWGGIRVNHGKWVMQDLLK